MSAPPPPTPPGQPAWGQQPAPPPSPPAAWQPPPPAQPAQPYGAEPAHPYAGPPAAPAAPAEPKGLGGLFRDASTLAATGLTAAVLFAVVAGLLGFVGSVPRGGLKERLLRLTDTVDVGDVALLGLAVALLLLTPDPPGGIRRSLLMQAAGAASAIIAVYSVIRSLVILTLDGSFLIRFSGFVATVGVGLAAFTIAFYAASESFMKKRQAL